jgi:EAL domain-containing protein (putative c-di-GMP-specific phosphodiesterase class I)
MHIAKETGKNTYQLFNEKMSARIDERLMLEHGLRRALDRDEFILYYQPCLDLSGYKVTGYEALIRWNHPEMGLVMPDRFIPLAEERGFIEHIDEWVLEKACRQAVSWQQTGLGRLKASVNISGRQFARTDLVGTVRRVLAETGLSANLLMLELTETTLVHNPEAAVSMLRQLKQMGVQIAIDDFGTGYSSLNYLKQFPIDALKVDRSFVRDITMNPNDAAIVGAIIAMAHSLCLRVIAEGVETQEQLEFLKMLQCDDMQGYLASRPVPAEEFPGAVSKITASHYTQSIQTSLQY